MKRCIFVYYVQVDKDTLSDLIGTRVELLRGIELDVGILMC